MEGTTTNAAARSGVRLMVTRVLAVLAVAGAAIALYVVISGSLDTSDGEEHANGGSKHHHQQQQSGDQSPETPETYVVQPGETMGGIAAKVGVPIERLEELNPQIDPQALPSGAVLKLR